MFSQVGIGTLNPDVSSALDITSNNKGLLIPRLSTSERNEIHLPATGLMIYNITMNDSQINIGTPLLPDWVGIKNQSEIAFNTVTENENTITSSIDNELLSGMSLSPTTGTYLILFNAQMLSSNSFSSNQGKIEIANLYLNLMSSIGGVAHGLVFGNDEVLLPGIYDVTGALSIAGTLTIDGQGNPDSVFIIRATGAFTTGASTIVNLTNQASASNIFWISEGAISTGDTTIMKGILFANNAAIALGANTNLEGKMFSTVGALTLGVNSTLNSPIQISNIDLGVLSSFAMFTKSGAVSVGANCTVTGDVGTGLGAISGFDNHVGVIYPEDTESNNIDRIVTYSIFQNGLELTNSRRTINTTQSIATIQTIVNVTAENNPIEVRWKVNTGEAEISFRTLSALRSNN